MLTAVITRCAIWLARGPSSMLKKTCSHAPRLTSISAASNRNVRPNSPSRRREVRFLKVLRKRGTRLRSCPGGLVDQLPPSGTNTYPRPQTVWMNTGLTGSARSACAGGKSARPGCGRRLRTRGRGPVPSACRATANLGMTREHLQHGEFARGDGHLFPVARQRAGGQVQHVGAEGDGFVFLAGAPGCSSVPRRRRIALIRASSSRGLNGLTGSRPRPSPGRRCGRFLPPWPSA